MNIKRFTLLSAVLLVATISSFSWFDDAERKYYPVDLNEKQHTSADGYLEFMQKIKANQETGEIDPALVFAARKQAELMPKGKSAIDFNWQFEGPDNIGGRTRALMIDKNDPNHLYAAGVAGGLFESIDGAQNWKPYNIDFMSEVNNISCITQSVDGSIYVGTGGHFERGGSGGRGYFFVGSGIHKLIGGGAYEQVIGPSNNLNTNIDYATVGEIVADPINNNILHVAMNNGYVVLTFDPATNSWSESVPVVPAAAKRCNDIDISDDGQTIVVTFGGFSNGGSIYVSNDGGLTFTNTTPTTSTVGRIECDIAPSDKNIIYAGVTGPGNTGSGSDGDCLVGIYRSKDGGQTWDLIQSGGTDRLDMYANPGTNCQGSWDNMVAVYPDDPGKIIVGGVTMYRWVQSSTDPAPSNGSWSRIDALLDFFPSGERVPNYVHADKHELVFDPRDSDVAYIATDGGVTKTTNFNDPNPTFTVHNYKFGVTQYYGMAVNARGIVMAGSQDNGSHLVNLSFNNNLGGLEVLGGDGFDAVLSVIDPSIGVASSQFNRIARIQGIGTSTGNSNISQADIVSTNQFLGGGCADPDPAGCGQTFYTALGLWESFNHEASRDSVNLTPIRTDIPPIPAGRVISFESNNNNVLQTYKLPNDIFPVDTISGSTDKRVSYKVADLFASGNALVMNFDTLSIDTTNKLLFVNRRSLPYTSISYQEGVIGSYQNVFTNSIGGGADVSYLVKEKDGELYLEVENAEIQFAYDYKVQDKVQSILASPNWPGLNEDYSRRNIFITRDLTKSKTDIVWHNVAGERSTPDPIRSDVLDIAFSPDGDIMYAGTQSGLVYRISGLNDLDPTLPNSGTSTLYNIQEGPMAGKCVEIGRFPGRAVTSIAIDPFNPDRMVVALGNYNNVASVARTENATTIMSSNGAFEPIQGTGSNALPLSPAYAAELVFGTSNGSKDSTGNVRLLIGNEQGMFASDNPFDPVASNVSWSAENSGLGVVPVFDIKQMPFGFKEVNDLLLDTIEALTPIVDNSGNILVLPTVVFEGDTIRDIDFIDSVRLEMESRLIPVENTASIYIATHGRGVYRSDALVNVKDNGDLEATSTLKQSMMIYPNPVGQNANLKLRTKNTSEPLSVSIFNIKGQLVRELRSERLQKGENIIPLSIGDLEGGTYILRTVQGKESASTKFIKR
ncbi:MAG: T9SS type A sorting domain-containing protein [Vicingaceae bacterium]